MKELKVLMEKQIKLGAIMPGSIKEQYSVCGKAECVCRDKIKPRKHGPYNQLSFSTKGKSSTMFIKSPDLKAGKEMTAAYKEYRTLTQKIGLAMIALCRKDGIQKAKLIYDDLYAQALRRYLGNKPESRKFKEVTVSRDQWKTKAVERKSDIEKLQVTVRDLINSRDNWKTKAMHQKEVNRGLNRELAEIKKNFTGSK